jgi:hypothetical protein
VGGDAWWVFVVQILMGYAIHGARLGKGEWSKSYVDMGAELFVFHSQK